MTRLKAICFSWLGPELCRHWGSSGASLLKQIFSGVVWQSRDLQLSRNTLYLSSPRPSSLILYGTFRDLFV